MFKNKKDQTNLTEKLRKMKQDTVHVQRVPSLFYQKLKSKWDSGHASLIYVALFKPTIRTLIENRAV